MIFVSGSGAPICVIYKKIESTPIVAIYHGLREYNGRILRLQLLYYVTGFFLSLCITILLLEIIDFIF